MIKQVVVLGGGSAGFLSAITCKYRLPQLRVTLVRSPGIGIIGVGEGTTPVVLTHLHGYLGLDPSEFYRIAQPTWKLGVRFLWGVRPYFNYTFSYQFDAQVQGLSKRNGYYCEEDCRFADTSSALMTQDRVFLRKDGGVPFIGKDLAYHLENKTLVGYLELVAQRLGVEIMDDTVIDVSQDEQGVQALNLEQHGALQGDLYLDCSGFRSLLLGQTLGEPFESFASTLFCDSAVVGGWTRGDDEPIKPYTTAETMDAGWCWQVEHESQINRGYVYSSRYIDDDRAEGEFRANNPRVNQTRIVRFQSGRYARSWVKNVVAVGNASGFVEPLESTSLGVICDDAQALSEALSDCELQPSEPLAREYNHRCQRIWSSIRNFLAIHYRFNQRRQTPFWRDCNQQVELNEAARIVEYFQEHGPSSIWRDFSVDHIDQFRLEGYLSLLIGQRVPYRRVANISPQERALWSDRCQKLAQLAAQGFTVEEALAIVRSDHWQWTPGFYRDG